MDEIDPVNSGESLSSAEAAAENVAAINEAATEAGDEKDALHRAVLAETTTRQDRGIVSDSAKQHATNQKSNTKDGFFNSSLATAYQHPITFNVGGRGVQLSLGSLRDIASTLYNQNAKDARNLSGDAKAKAQKKMKAYDGLLGMIDLVAAGQMSPAELNNYIQEQGLGQDIADTANQMNIKTVDVEPMQQIVADSGSLAGQTPLAQKAAAIDQVFG